MKNEFKTWGGIELPESFCVVIDKSLSSSGESLVRIALVDVDARDDCAAEYIRVENTWRVWGREDFELGQAEVTACQIFRNVDPDEAPEFHAWRERAGEQGDLSA